jgi:transcriptional regulator of NAD metabolism
MIDILEFMGKSKKERQEIMDKMSEKELKQLLDLQTRVISGLLKENVMIVRDK